MDRLNEKIGLTKISLTNLLNCFGLTKTTLIDWLKKSRISLIGVGKASLSGKRGGGNGVGVASDSRTHIEACKPNDLFSIEARRYVSITCKLTDTLYFLAMYALRPSGTLPVVSINASALMFPYPLFLTTPTHQNFERLVYITPHRPHAIFHDSKYLKQILRGRL